MFKYTGNKPSYVAKHTSTVASDTHTIGQQKDMVGSERERVVVRPGSHTDIHGQNERVCVPDMYSTERPDAHSDFFSIPTTLYLLSCLP